MNTETTIPVAKSKKPKWILISIIALIVLLLSATALFATSVLHRNTFYKGIYIENQDVSNLTKEVALRLLTEQYSTRKENTKIELKTPTLSHSLQLSDIHASIALEDAIEKAYRIGRTGNVFEKLSEIFKTAQKNEIVPVSITYDEEGLEQIIQTLYDQVSISVKESDLLINDHQVVIRSGHHGESFDKQAVLSTSKALIEALKSGVVDIEIIHTPPSKINVDHLYNEIVAAPINASVTVSDNQIVFAPHVLGRKIDKNTLIDLIADLEKKENAEKNLPIEYVTPEMTYEQVKSAVFRDELTRFSTSFTTTDPINANRGENIKLAASKIDGKILAPGEEFSFNDTVGRRSVEAGYKVAHVYSGGKIIDGIGGGICQVSTTLYNSVLLADLEVTERRNHTFTVGYAKKGRDATVSFGSVDFKFKNSTRWPIKVISLVTTENEVIFKLVGTNENTSKKVDILSTTVEELPYKIIYKDDPTMATGVTKVIQSGKKGYIIDTFKVIWQDGKRISETKLHTSKYLPLNEEILRGTKKVASSVAPITTPSVSIPAVDAGIDDADNPPAVAE